MPLPTLHEHNFSPRALMSATKTALKRAFQELSRLLSYVLRLIPPKIDLILGGFRYQKISGAKFRF